MKRFVTLSLVLSLLGAFTAGCEQKKKAETSTTTSGPGGSTTTTDTHTVESSGQNPPANAKGETGK